MNLLCENIVRSMEMKVSEGVALVFDSNLPQYHLDVFKRQVSRLMITIIGTTYLPAGSRFRRMWTSILSPRISIRHTPTLLISLPRVGL